MVRCHSATSAPDAGRMTDPRSRRSQSPGRAARSGTLAETALTTAPGGARAIFARERDALEQRPGGVPVVLADVAELVHLRGAHLAEQHAVLLKLVFEVAEHHGIDRGRPVQVPDLL